jgi:hypothetical protein
MPRGIKNKSGAPWVALRISERLRSLGHFLIRCPWVMSRKKLVDCQGGLRGQCQLLTPETPPVRRRHTHRSCEKPEGTLVSE